VSSALENLFAMQLDSAGLTGYVREYQAIPGRSATVQKTCDYCGKEFYSYQSQNRKYCSKECWNNKHTENKKVTRICAHCGEKFEAYRIDIENGSRGTFCSEKCLNAHFEDSYVEKKCQYCGKKFKIVKGRAKDNRGKFCSKNCQEAYRETQNANVKCLYCGKEMRVLKSDIAVGKGRFCSRSCSTTYHLAKEEKDYNVTKDRQSKSGKREDLDNRYFRSSWEANYARYLNWLIDKGEIKSWEFESETFDFPVKRGNMRYLPDFKVTNNDGSVEYHEVKGYMTNDSRVKLNRMAKYYPNVKLVLIDAPVYEELNRQLKHLIPNWEIRQRS